MSGPRASLFAPREVQAVVFDAVGTVLVPQPPLEEAYHRHAQALGSRLSAQQVSRRFHAAFARHFGSAPLEPCNERTERELWARVVQDVFGDQQVECQRLFVRLWDHFARCEHWALCPGVTELWTWLHRHGYRLAVASNFDRRLEAICRGKPPLDLAEAVFTCTNLGVRKPSVEFFRRIAARVELDPRACLMVGDTLRADVLPALEAGWQAVHLCSDHPLQEPPGAITRIGSLLQLVTLLDH